MKNDIIHVKGYRDLAKSNFSKVTFIENLEDHFTIATKSLKEIVSEKIKIEIHVSIKAGTIKTTLHKKSAGNSFISMSN